MKIFLDWLRSHWLGLLFIFAGILVPLALLGKIADRVQSHRAVHFDDPTLLWLHSFATPSLDWFFSQVSIWGGSRGITIFGLLIMIGLWRNKRPAAAVFFLAAVGGALVLNMFSKNLFGRARPALWLSIAPERDFSFPSGHSMCSMAFGAALVLIFWNTRARWPVLAFGICFPLLVGLSRMYLGVHYPTDVIGGFLAGLVWVNGLWLLHHQKFPGAQRHQTPVAL